MLRIIKEIAATVKLANSIAANSDGNGPKWSLFITNRSFIAQVFALIFALLGLFGVPLPIGADVAAEAVYGLAFAITSVWAFIERVRGKTTVVWNKNQADALTEALKKAGAK